MLIIYTGNGKGKTSASVGQAFRAKGQGKRVVFAQFFKRPDQAGEQKLLQEILQSDFYARGPGFYMGDESKLEIQQSAAKDLIFFIKSKINTPIPPFMLVLDEALYALASNIIIKEELEEIIDTCTANNIHLVLSGRGLPPWLEERADLISVIDEKKHPYATGQKAQEGIEY